MSLFIIPTQLEQAHPSHGCQFFNDYQPSQISFYSQSPDFFDAVRRGNSHSSFSYSQALAAQYEAQERKAAIARARREELERRYDQHLRLVQAQRQQKLEAQRRLRQRQEQEEMHLYQRLIQRRVAAQQDYLRRVRLQKPQLERQRSMKLQREQQQQSEQLRLKSASSQDPLLLALEELFGDAFFGSSPAKANDVAQEIPNKANEVAQVASKGKEPVRGQVEGQSSPALQSPSVVPSQKAEAPEAPQPEPSTSTSTSTQPTRQLVFTHAFPSQENSSSIPTDQIEVSVDEKSGTVQVSGLWDTQEESQAQSTPISRPASPTLSQHSSTSSKQRKAHVSDVDEDGNEIESEDWDMAVDVVEEERKKVTAPSLKTTTRTFTLPEGAKPENLKAEIHDDGFKIYVEQ